MRRWLVLWLASLVVVAVLVSVLTAAQTNQANQRVLSGTDIGFRIDRSDRAGRPVGALVVRINGNWVEATYAATPAPVISQ